MQATSESEVLAKNAVRQYTRQKRLVISDDYLVYSLEHECDLSTKMTLSHLKAMECDNSKGWFLFVKEELKLMDGNKVCELVQLPLGSKQVGCKWVF